MFSELMEEEVDGRSCEGKHDLKSVAVQEPAGSSVERAARSTSRSAISRTFVERPRGSLGELMSRASGKCA